MLTERLTLNALMLSAVAGGWSFHRVFLQRMQAMFRRAGLGEYTARLEHGVVHYHAGGEGQRRPLLLIHGFGGDAMWGWYGQTGLARDHFLVIPDLLWFGGSHGRRDDWSTTYQAATLVELLDHLAIDRADVVGISYGGFVALELAHGWGDRVGRLLLMDSPGHTYTLDDYHEMLERKDLDSVAELVVPDGPAGVPELLSLAYHRPPPVPGFVARDIYTNMFLSHRDEKVRLLDDLLARADEYGADDFHIPQRTRILWGEKDDLFPPHLAWRLAAALGDQADVRIIPRAAHAPPLERPLRVNREIRSFLHGSG